MSTQDLVIIKPSISAIAPSSEGGCLSSAMLRAKIDLRQPSFLLRPRTVTATVSSQGLKNTQFPRFGAEIILHIIGMRTSLRDPRTSVLCTGAPTSLPRELHSSDLHMRSRGVPERAHRRTSPLPRACSVNPGLCCSFMKSTRLRLDPQGYITGDAGVTQRSAHKRSLQCSTTLCPCETEREHEMAA
jgi:hypothetical protein